MKKIKEAVSLLTICTMLINPVIQVSAERERDEYDELYGGPGPFSAGMDGYELVESDYGLWQNEVYFEYGDQNFPEPAYVVYREAEKHDRVWVGGYVHQNLLMIEKTEGTENADIQEVYEKYSEELDYDYTFQWNTWGLSSLMSGSMPLNMLAFYDNRDEIGNVTAVDSAIPDKQEQVKAFCEELYQLGLIDRAAYVGYAPALAHFSMVTTDFVIDNVAASAEELLSIVSVINEDITVVENVVEENVSYVIGNIENPDDLWAAAAALRAAYPESEFDNHEYGIEPYNFLGIETVDILALLEMESNIPDGDVNADGTTDITDAVLILQHYAESAASGVSTASETNMDVNGDGSIDLDDASAVLQIYAENAAGVDAS